MAKPYNGHHCWNCWNVSLWIGNDEGLYRAALECKHGASHWLAVKRFIRDVVGETGRTPDGARYTVTGVSAALRGLE